MPKGLFKDILSKRTLHIYTPITLSIIKVKTRYERLNWQFLWHGGIQSAF